MKRKKIKKERARAQVAVDNYGNNDLYNTILYERQTKTTSKIEENIIGLLVYVKISIAGKNCNTYI